MLIGDCVKYLQAAYAYKPAIGLDGLSGRDFVRLQRALLLLDGQEYSREGLQRWLLAAPHKTSAFSTCLYADIVSKAPTCPLMIVGPSLVRGFAAPSDVRPFVLNEGGSAIAAFGQIQI